MIMKMNEPAVCEPYVSSSVTESDESLFPSQEYKTYPSYHMEPSPSPVYSSEEAVTNLDSKPPPPFGGEVSSCSYSTGQGAWRQQHERHADNNIILGVEHQDVKPHFGIKREVEQEQHQQHHKQQQQQHHHHHQHQHHQHQQHHQQQHQQQQQQHHQQQQQHHAELEPQSERRTGVIRCVDTSMPPPPDGVTYDSRSRRPSGGFVRPIDGLRPGDIFKCVRYKDVRRSHDPPPPPPPPPPSPLTQQQQQQRPDHNSSPEVTHHNDPGRGSPQCPPATPSSPSSSSTNSSSSSSSSSSSNNSSSSSSSATATGSGSGRSKSTAKKERKKEDVEDVSSSIPDLEFDGTTVLCRVCGDKASGFHYGVHSCEGCKGFFRRSIQQKIQYRPCTKNQQCAILRINRNRCQYCRLKKCISVGMSRDAVRFGRVPKREKAKILAAMQSVNARTHEKAVLAELDDDTRVIAAIIRAHMDTCEFTRDKVAPMLQQARAHPSYTQCPPTLACPLNPRPVPLHGQQEMVQDFSERFSPAIRGVVEFAKRLPAFQQLPQEDQVTLLKAGVFEVLLVRLAGMFDASTNTMLCLNGQLLRREALHTSVNARFLMDSMFDFAERVNCLSLSDAEIALFCAVVVLAPDRPGLRNADLVERVQRRLVSCLQTVIAKHHPDNPSLQRELLCKIPDLRTLNTLHSEKLLKYKMTEHKAATAAGAWDDRCSWGEQESIGSPSSSCTADEAMRSPVSCSESFMGESASSAESLCGSESSGYSELRPPFPLAARRRHDLEGASSGDEAMETPLKCPFSKRKSDSPDDSGIESGTDRSDKLSSPSVCSSPRSSIDEKSEEDREEDMPVLRRALQAPPIINTDLLIEEVYKPHKKFRALRREDEPHSSQPTQSILAQTLSQPLQQTPSLVSTHSSVASPHSTLASSLASTLASTLCTDSSNKLAASHTTLARSLLDSKKTTEDHMRRADILHTMIMRHESPREQLSSPSSSSNNRVSPAPYHVPQAALDRLQPPTSSWSCPSSRNCPSSSSSSSSCSSNSLSPMQPTVTAQPRLHLLTTPTPSRYYEPKVSVTPVGLGAQPSSSPGAQIPSPSQSGHPLGMGVQPHQRTSLSPVVELQVDIADSQPLNLSKKTPPPTPQEFILEA